MGCDYAIEAVKSGDSSVMINDFLASCNDGACVRFAPGEYYLGNPIEIRGKRGLTLDMTGCVFKVRYDRSQPYGVNCDGVHIVGCDFLTLRGGTLKNEVPFNVNGQVLSVDGMSAVVRLEPLAPYTMKESFMHGTVCYDDGRPNLGYLQRVNPDTNARTFIGREIVATSPRWPSFDCEWIDETTVRLKDVPGIQRLEPGRRCILCHSYYDIAAFVLTDSNNVVIEDLSVPNWGGMVFVVLPRCENLTLRNVSIVPEEGSGLWQTTGADGVHTIGLGGLLKMEKCSFTGLRDDALNLHTQFLTVKEMGENGSIRVHYNKYKGRVCNNWARRGDTLRVYDPENGRLRGLAVVDSFHLVHDSGDPEGIVTLSSCGCALREGDLVTNAFYYAKLEVTGCTFNMYRRSLVIQSSDGCVVENNTFNDSNPAVYISMNCGKYLEAGGVSDAVIANNRIVNAKNGYALWTRVGGPGTLGPSGSNNTIGHPVHKNLVFVDNEIIDCNSNVVQACLCATDGLTFMRNTFRNSGFNPILMDECDNVTMRDNCVMP